MSAVPSLVRPNLQRSESEFNFDAADFDQIRKLIHQRAGISLHAGKQAMVYSRLSRRLRDAGYKSFGQYLQALERSTGAAGELEWQEFINCLTTNLTSFFREEHHFSVLQAELVERKIQSPHIWCNAASTGEEPYSLAMTAIETLGASASCKIYCSDIDTRVLATAQSGVYAADARGLNPQRLRQHFMRGTGTNDGFIRVRPELRRLVEFHAFNLVDERWSFSEPFDIVFCRNVMIYFDAPTQRRVLERMHRVIKPHGLMFAGHSENFADSKDLFRLRGKTVYERV